jgi:hypothetical protein
MIVFNDFSDIWEMMYIVKRRKKFEMFDVLKNSQHLLKVIFNMNNLVIYKMKIKYHNN